MPRKSSGHNNPSHKRERKRVAERMDSAMREARFNTMAAQNMGEFDPVRCGFRQRLDIYEWALRHALRLGVEIPRLLRMGSAMGWLNEHISGYEAGEKQRVTAREEAETKHEDKLFEAFTKRLHQWIPQPVPDDFECPYTGLPADKRKILATGTRYERRDGATPSERGSHLYGGHDTIVLYKTGHRGKWHTAREIWSGARDSQGNRVEVTIEQTPFGEVNVTRQLGAQAPGLPYRGPKGYSGQVGRPILREEAGPRPDVIDPRRVVQTRVGFDTEADARKQAMLYIISAFAGRSEDGPLPAAVMGREHIDLRRAKRMRGGARTREEMQVSPPASETSGERHTATIPAHLWSGEIVQDDAPRIVKKRRVRKKSEDSDEVRNLIRNNRIRALS